MNHLIVCREYPPAPGGGIGAYTGHLAHLLASRGEVVHVVAQQWHGASRPTEHHQGGRLVIHRLPYDNWATPWGRRPHPALAPGPARRLFSTAYPPTAFAWQAAALIERLVELAAIDLIEAPEFEAPLAVFQRRRALGLGPRRRPPCLVHLHSPTEFIARHNGWPSLAADLLAAAQLEAYTLVTADGLLCPSQALAAEASAHYGLPPAAITVIPLPLGPDPGPLIRAPTVWTGGSICFVGRLEPRKGVLEYLEAAVAVARERPDLAFEFAGANVLSSDPVSSAALIEERLPRPLRRQFRFLGQLPRAALPAVLRRARLAVVPSRWENFPYAAAEALRSGLPLLATRAGALPQMIANGRTGWLVDDCAPAALAAGLRQALAVAPADLQAMGAAAGHSIREMCDPDRLAEQHLAVRAALVRQGSTGALHDRQRHSAQAGLWLGAGAPRAEDSGRPEELEAELLAILVPASAVEGAVPLSASSTGKGTGAARNDQRAGETSRYLALEPGPRALSARLALLARTLRHPRLFLYLVGWLAQRLLRAAAWTPSVWESARLYAEANAETGGQPVRPHHA